MNKTFKHSLNIYLKDSNAYGNTYFSRYFEWQGICREKWFYSCISKDMLKNLGVFVTKEAHQEYLEETFPFETIECHLNTFNVKQCSFGLVFNFMRNGTSVSLGTQQLVFTNHNKVIQRLPADILTKIKKFSSKF